MTNNSSFLSRKLDNMNIKCLSTKVSTHDFCRKEKPNFEESRLKELSRGVVLHNEDSVICEFVDSINVTVSCKSNLIKNECLFSKDSCLKIKKIYAADLELFHHSNPTGAKVNCLFVKNDFFELNAL